MFVATICKNFGVSALVLLKHIEVTRPIQDGEISLGNRYRETGKFVPTPDDCEDPSLPTLLE
jgi:hypothetical protein